jgi:hypothetical protein
MTTTVKAPSVTRTPRKPNTPKMIPAVSFTRRRPTPTGTRYNIRISHMKDLSSLSKAVVESAFPNLAVESVEEGKERKRGVGG